MPRPSEKPSNSLPIDRHEFRNLMRNVPGQVSIIATGAPGDRRGLTASAVCSLTDLPPTVIVCINRSAGAHDLIIETGVFSVNALASNQERVAHTFSGAAGVSGEQRFQTGDWCVGETGAPVLTSAVCRLECRLSEYTEASSHTIFFGHVVAGSACTRANALLYVRGNYVGLKHREDELALAALGRAPQTSISEE